MRLGRARIALESSPSRAPQAPPGLAGRPPTHPYHPNARPYVGVWPDSTTRRKTKFCTRTQFDAAGKKHAHNLSKSGLNGLMMLPMPLREDGVALLDHERRRKSCRPLPLRTPQRNVRPQQRGGPGHSPQRRKSTCSSRVFVPFRTQKVQRLRNGCNGCPGVIISGHPETRPLQRPHQVDHQEEPARCPRRRTPTLGASEAHQRRRTVLPKAPAC